MQARLSNPVTPCSFNAVPSPPSEVASLCAPESCISLWLTKKSSHQFHRWHVSQMHARSRAHLRSRCVRVEFRRRLSAIYVAPLLPISFQARFCFGSAHVSAPFHTHHAHACLRHTLLADTSLVTVVLTLRMCANFRTGPSRSPHPAKSSARTPRGSGSSGWAAAPSLPRSGLMNLPCAMNLRTATQPSGSRQVRKGKQGTDTWRMLLLCHVWGRLTRLRATFRAQGIRRRPRARTARAHRAARCEQRA